MALFQGIYFQGGVAASGNATFSIPVGEIAIVTAFFVVNENATSTTIDIAILPAGTSSPSSQHYLYKGFTLNGNDTFSWSGRLPMSPQDSFYVAAGSGGGVAFSVFGDKK